MNYYAKRRAANALIDQMKQEGANDKQIIFELGERYGFSAHFFNRRVQLLGEIKNLRDEQLLIPTDKEGVIPQPEAENQQE